MNKLWTPFLLMTFVIGIYIRPIYAHTTLDEGVIEEVIHKYLTAEVNKDVAVLEEILADEIKVSTFFDGTLVSERTLSRRQWIQKILDEDVLDANVEGSNADIADGFARVSARIRYLIGMSEDSFILKTFPDAVFEATSDVVITLIYTDGRWKIAEFCSFDSEIQILVSRENPISITEYGHE